MFKEKWFGRQKWSEIIFVHWPVEKNILQQYVPYPFRIATVENQAYLSVVAFQAQDSRFKMFPKKFSFRPFWQINVRTYIRFGREFGIYFFALYSNDLLAVLMGRLPGLPYKQADIKVIRRKNQRILSLFSKAYRQEVQLTYNNQRTAKMPKDERVNFLTNHKNLYFIKNDKIFQGRIFHKPWRLFYVDGQVQTAEFFDSISLQAKSPILMAGHNQQSYLYPFQKLGYINTNID